MKITKLIAIFCLFVPSLAFAQAPAWMPVQAYLADAEGAPLSGEHDIGLTLYDADGQALFAETQTVMLDEGLATLYLGANQTLDLALFVGNQEISLGIAVDDDPEMSPRFTLGTVPFAAFAQHSASADSLGEHSAEDFLLAADDADTLAGLTCAEGQVAKVGTEGWICADDVDTDALAALSCAEGQLPKASAAGWVCADDIDTDIDTDTLASLICADDQVVKASATGWVCGDDIDTDIDTDTLASLICADDQVVKASATGWVCADDIDIDTLAALTCADDQVAKASATGWVCADDIDIDTLAALICADDQVVKATATGWVCADDIDTDTDTFAALTCADGEVPKASSTGWLCGTDINTDSGGDITGVTAGAGLLGGGDTGAVALSADFAGTGAANSVARSDHNHNLAYSLLTHNHDASYVNEGQADSITSAMIRDSQVTSADIADGAVGASEIATNAVGTSEILDGTILGTDINPATTITAAGYNYQSAQTRYHTIAGSSCRLKNPVIVSDLFFCQLNASNSAYWTVDVPNGATIRGFKVYLWDFGGQISCTLRSGISNFGSILATVNSTNDARWHWTTEATLSHVVDTANFAYGVQCISDASSVDQPVGALRVAYTVSSPD